MLHQHTADCHTSVSCSSTSPASSRAVTAIIHSALHPTESSPVKRKLNHRHTFDNQSRGTAHPSLSRRTVQGNGFCVSDPLCRAQIQRTALVPRRGDVDHWPLKRCQVYVHLRTALPMQSCCFLRGRRARGSHDKHVFSGPEATGTLPRLPTRCRVKTTLPANS